MIICGRVQVVYGLIIQFCVRLWYDFQALCFDRLWFDDEALVRAVSNEFLMYFKAWGVCEFHIQGSIDHILTPMVYGLIFKDYVSLWLEPQGLCNSMVWYLRLMYGSIFKYQLQHLQLSYSDNNSTAITTYNSHHWHEPMSICRELSNKIIYFKLRLSRVQKNI